MQVQNLFEEEEEKVTKIEREITYLSRFWSSNFEEKQQSKGSDDERERAKRNKITKKLFGDFRYLILYGAGEDQEEGCIHGRQCHLRIEKCVNQSCKIY